LLAAAFVAGVFLNKTIWGRYLLALGRNEEAARYSGINTARVTMIAYVICTAAAATGGMLFALDSNSVSPSSFGNFFELYAIAAAVLGGCSLRGGEGTILGVIIGTAVMQILNNLILLMKISDELEFAIIGTVILIGVSSDELVKRIAAKRRAIASTRALEQVTDDSAG
jgi:ribose transport system permease protein